MKKFVAILLVALLALGLATGCGNSGSNNATTGSDSNSSSGSDEVINIKIGHGIPEDTAMHQAWVKFKEIVEEKSGGKIKVAIYPNQQLGGDRELTEAVQMGNVTMTAPSSAPLANFCKEFYVLDYPFLFENRETVYRVLDGEAGTALLEALSGTGIKGLAFWENGFRNITSNKPIRTPDDLKGLKIRTMENELHIAAWQMLGANPTPLAFGELYTALQQKTVDAQENPFELIYNNKFYEVQKYATKTRHIYSPYVIIMNEEFYNNLSPEYQKLITDAIKECTGYQRQIAEANEKRFEEAIKQKTEIIELSESELSQFKEKVAPILDQVKAKAGEDIVNKFIAEVGK